MVSVIYIIQMKLEDFTHTFDVPIFTYRNFQKQVLSKAIRSFDEIDEKSSEAANIF